MTRRTKRGAVNPSDYEAICEVCGRPIKHKNDMARHMKTHAVDKDSLMHRCPHEGCPYASLQKSNLKTHMATHTGEKNHECTDVSWCSRTGRIVVCEFKTSDPGSLSRHRKNVHGYVPKCSTPSVSPEAEPGPSTAASPQPQAGPSNSGRVKRRRSKKGRTGDEESPTSGRESPAGGRDSRNSGRVSRRYSPYSHGPSLPSSSSPPSPSSPSIDVLLSMPEVIDSSPNFNPSLPLSADAAFLFYGMSIPAMDPHTGLPPMQLPAASFPIMDGPCMGFPATDVAAAHVPAADLLPNFGGTFAGPYVDADNNGFWLQHDASSGGNMGTFDGIMPEEAIHLPTADIQCLLQLLDNLPPAPEPTFDTTQEVAINAPQNDFYPLPAQCPPPQSFEQQLYQNDYGGGVNLYDAQASQQMVFNAVQDVNFNAFQTGASLLPAQCPPLQVSGQQMYSNDLGGGFNFYNWQPSPDQYSPLSSPLDWPELLGNSLNVAQDPPHSLFGDFIASNVSSPNECPSDASSPSPSLLDLSVDAFLLPPLFGNDEEFLLQAPESLPPC